MNRVVQLALGRDTGGRMTSGGGERAARDTHARRVFTGLLATLCALVTAACPVPMRYTERLAPAIIGVVRTESGAPAAGVALAVSTRADCRHQVAADTSDATGTFRIP